MNSATSDRSTVTLERDSNKLIQIWKCAAAPAQYKELFPAASERHWIALVPANLVWQFTYQLWMMKCSDTKKIHSCQLAGGATVFCGPIEN